jgi:hypothetical protein
MYGLGQDCTGYILKNFPRASFADDDPNFRSLLIHLLGVIEVEDMGNALHATPFSTIYQNMVSSLETLKHYRDELAHTYTRGTIHAVLAPSSTIGLYQHVYSGLKELESRVSRIPKK